MQTWRLVRLYFVNPLTGNKINKWMVFDRQDKEVCSRDTQREAVLAGLMQAKLDGTAVQIVGDSDEPTVKDSFTVQNGGYYDSIVSSLRTHAGSLRGPNHDVAREAANAIESLVGTASLVVKSADNWRNVQPVNPQIKQDIDLLRAVLGITVASAVQAERNEGNTNG